MNQKSPIEILMAGAMMLKAVLEPHGFTFTLDRQGTGSGGTFAFGSFRRAERRLELHYRYSLGLVTYHIATASLDHETYMRLLGVYGRNRYPDFPNEPLQSFQHLAEDIQDFCQDFTQGDGQKFIDMAATFARQPKMCGGVP